MKKEDYLAEEFEHAKKIVKIYHDPDPVDPRKDYDNMSILSCWHLRYKLGDKQIDPCSSEDLIREHEDKGDPILAILPLYLLDHSGLSIRTTSFGCSWDSGQVGWGYITRSKANAMGWMNTDDGTDWEEIIRSEVKTYDDVMNHNVYGYEVYGMKDDFIGSCWGYIGDDGFKQCVNEAKQIAEQSEDPEVIREVEALQSRITYASVF